MDKREPSGVNKLDTKISLNVMGNVRPEPTKVHKSNSKVLFLYHNEVEDGYMPPNLAVLSGKMEENGVETQIFDTSFWRDEGSEFIVDRGVREKLGSYKKVDGWNPTREIVNIKDKFREALETFKPDLVAATSTSHEFNSIQQFIEPIKKEIPFKIIFGGPHATVAPQVAINAPAVDYICVGEGEDPLLELVHRLEMGKDTTGIPGIWVKTDDGNIVQSIPGNQSTPMDNLPMPHWDMFDERHRLRPYEGEIKRYGFWEMSRGCQYNCSYCINSTLHKITVESGKLRDRPGAYRFHSPEVIIERMVKYKKKYKYNHVQFIDENMATMPVKTLTQFAEMYKKEIGLGFFTQTRPEYFIAKPEKAEIMADMGCLQLGIGAESGSNWLRKNVLDRPQEDGTLEKGCEILRKVGIKIALYYIIGFPFETKEMVEETLAMHARILPDRHSVRFLQPYLGTPIRDLCIKEGYIPENFDASLTSGGFFAGPVMDLPSPPHPTNEELMELRGRFLEISTKGHYV